MNIQALSDTELNRAMIWLYGPAWMLVHEKYRDQGQDIIESTLNYLNEWGLVMPLAHKKGLSIALINGRASHGMSVTNNYVSATNKENPLRAICEVLVMIGMEGK